MEDGIINAVLGALGEGTTGWAKAAIAGVVALSFVYIRVSKQRVENRVTLSTAADAQINKLNEQIDDLREQSEKQVARIDDLSSKIEALRDDLHTTNARRILLEDELGMADRVIATWESVADYLLKFIEDHGISRPPIARPKWPLRSRDAQTIPPANS